MPTDERQGSATSGEAPGLPTLADTPYQAERAQMLIRLLPRHSIGAEVGVFRGEFAASILRAIAPKELYLVDPWDLAYGETYPDWGDYTERGALRTDAAFAETVSRTSSQAKTRVHIVKNFSEAWLRTMPDAYFDWIYLDSTHQYDDTLRELELCRLKIKPEGIICGHDYEIDRNGTHHGLFRAVTAFMRKGEFDLIWAGPQQQWALRRAEGFGEQKEEAPKGVWRRWRERVRRGVGKD